MIPSLFNPIPGLTVIDIPLEGSETRRSNSNKDSLGLSPIGSPIPSAGAAPALIRSPLFPLVISLSKVNLSDIFTESPIKELYELKEKSMSATINPFLETFLLSETSILTLNLVPFDRESNSLIFNLVDLFPSSSNRYITGCIRSLFSAFGTSEPLYVIFAQLASISLLLSTLFILVTS